MTEGHVVVTEDIYFVPGSNANTSQGAIVGWSLWWDTIGINISSGKVCEQLNNNLLNLKLIPGARAPVVIFFIFIFPW